MSKSNVLYGFGGIAIGLLLGFFVANKLNIVPADTESANSNTNSSSSNLPPNHPPFGQNSGSSIDAQQPQITEAIERAEKNPDDFEAQITAGDLYYQIRRPDDAINFYEKAKNLKPNDLEPVVKLGNSYFDLEQYVLAEKYYEIILQKTPGDLNVRTDYALTFFLRKPRDIERAVREFNKNLETDPDHELTLQNLIVIYTESGDSLNLQRIENVLKAINPKNPILKRSDAK